ncbi:MULTISPECIES: hypothetical protein [Methylobacteriaceae]|jgi:hypothetical protein|uniref:hypothetical protein n=1 Tax=Methylobacteriaceae TaxID=119045 RepID=UPI00103D9C83|nr:MULTISPECIES: hypothetical protein [Methylobacteriaceae]
MYKSLRHTTRSELQILFKSIGMKGFLLEFELSGLVDMNGSKKRTDYIRGKVDALIEDIRATRAPSDLADRLETAAQAAWKWLSHATSAQLSEAIASSTMQVEVDNSDSVLNSDMAECA